MPSRQRVETELTDRGPKKAYLGMTEHVGRRKVADKLKDSEGRCSTRHDKWDEDIKEPLAGGSGRIPESGKRGKTWGKR